MKAEQIEKFKLKIKEVIEETENRIAEMEKMTQPIGPDDAIGRVSRMDAINNKSVSEAALRSAKRKLGKLQQAILNADKPNFGLCALCKRPIPEGRLMLMPESTRCVRCADRR